jgi:phosphatidylinositol-bisphosphatase
VVAHFRVIPKLEEKYLCKPWLTINPPFGMIIPGEKTTVEVTVHVDPSTVSALTTGQVG